VGWSDWKTFAYEHDGVEPDIMAIAKSLAGGVPIGAVLMKKGVAESFKPGDHASTFGGNPLATAAGVAAHAVIRVAKGESKEEKK
jgi:acetylornithine/succinyldiaminopimelate/putrescine aminotransferase